MSEQVDCTVSKCVDATKTGEYVTIRVEHEHALLRLKQGLPWAEIRDMMVKKWQENGKNVYGLRPGQRLDVWLYVPLIILMIVKKMHPREMEAYISENAVARVFISRQGSPMPQIRDHSNIARTYAALGADGIEEIIKLIVKEAVACGFGDPKVLSSDTTAQELPIGYPHEAGILGGIAQRIQRALVNLSKKGKEGLEEAMEKTKQVIRKVKEYHLFAKGKEEKNGVLTQIVNQAQELISLTTPIVEAIGQTTNKVIKGACQKIQKMKQVTDQLIPQVQYWMKTGLVAKNKILHAGIPEARSIVRNKTGKKTEFGFKYLINRIGGGYLFIKQAVGVCNETKVPLTALQCYREVFGKDSCPELFAYDRGGWANATNVQLQKQGVRNIGIQPKGKANWLIAEDLRETVKSHRAMTEGSIGILKSDTYGFNKPTQRSNQALIASAMTSTLSVNLNRFMKDLIKAQPKLSANLG